MKITSGPLLAKCYHTQDKYLSFFKAISTDFSNQIKQDIESFSQFKDKTDLCPSPGSSSQNFALAHWATNSSAGCLSKSYQFYSNWRNKYIHDWALKSLTQGAFLWWIVQLIWIFSTSLNTGQLCHYPLST